MKFFYSKSILSEDVITDVQTEFHCEDIGICTLSKYHNFEYNHVSLNDDVDWERLVFITFRLAIFNLIVKNLIKVNSIEYKESYLGNLFEFKTRHFLLEPEKKAKIDDLFSSSILNIFNKLYIKQKSKVHLHELITETFDFFIGATDSYLLPGKRVLLKIFDLYVSKYKWLKFEEDYHLLGTHYKYRVWIEPIYIPRLKLQHDSITNSYNVSLKGNISLRNMVKRIDNVLEFNYAKRKPFSDSSGGRFGNSRIEFLIPRE
ncbi:hypothetical protein [Seonamhaeicola maritimus]|uniref:Uncharacterized protein n=1 Tax=Seonamhaeicola maritimus TaxID=2591822 RepID=A0A5C7GNN9_9FLAO|nr:hypothetical protein [Seonamhaeicola maritimus]TXG39697.1 hypothetical protein FUA22_07475 [Seonamhaeicola maritimus]